MATGGALRSAVADRARYRCEYCHYPEAASNTPLELDHVLPEAKDGPTTLGNLALSCRACNLHKYVKTEARDPLTVGNEALFHPRNQQCSEHFGLNLETAEIVGVTPIGRATVEALSMNSHHALATRQLLIRLGLMGSHV
jgi:5-methylcytosine-specific restriction endonuclease McrA